MKAKELQVTDFLKGNYEKSTHYTQVNYIFAYSLLGHDWAFTTNCRMNVLALIMTYKGRWGIETTFRVMDLADIKSKSTEIVTRTFMFLVSIVLYNLWLEFKEKKPVTFEIFLDYLALASKSKKQIVEEAEETANEHHQLNQRQERDDDAIINHAQKELNEENEIANYANSRVSRALVISITLNFIFILAIVLAWYFLFYK